MTRVLIVDDDPVTVLAARTSLEAAGFDVTTSQDPRQALDLATSDPPDVAVLDVVMPEMSGFELFRALRQAPSTRSLPIVFLSARGEAENRIRGLREGAEDFVVKPFDPVELALRVGRVARSPDSEESALEGNLQDFPCPTVLQRLQEEKKSGLLTLSSAKGHAVFVLDEGTVRSAALGSLTGTEAVLAALDLETGRFEFETRPVSQDRPSWADANLDIQSILLRSAWIEDQTRRLSPLLPKPGEVFARSGPVPPEDLERWPELALPAIAEALEEGVPSTLVELAKELALSPAHLRLALAVLRRSGTLVLVKGSAPTPQRDPG
ncbi:MAG: response regulator [Acidobacteriota bacterium]